LLVVDLDKIIKGAGKQKTSTIHLNIFPTEANKISSIFMEFTDNMHKQMWLIGKDFHFRLKQLLSGGQPPTNVSTAYSRSFASEIRYFFLPYTKYASEKLPFSSAKSLAECSTPIYAVLP